MNLLGREPDAMLRRFERNQVLVCAAMAAVCLLAGRADVAGGAIGGALLMAVGYGGIKAAVNVLTLTGNQVAGGRRSRRQRAWMLAKFALRYALLAFAAYVMLIRLHVHPLGVMLGASAPVVAAAIEGVSIVRRGIRPGHLR